MQSQSRQSIALANSQNFSSAALADRLIAESSIQPGELVLDLGAGARVIRESLANHGCHVIAVEKDPSLASDLRNRFAQTLPLQVRQCDLMDVPLPSCRYEVFSNIPFDVTSRAVNRLIRAKNPPDAYLMVQREAAERFLGVPRCTLVAGPGISLV